MPRKCTICESQRLREIDESLVSGNSIREIARTFAVPYHSVDRHKKNHLPPLLAKAKQAEDVVEGTSLVDRIERIMARCEMIAETATKAKDWGPAIAASRELRGCLELLAKVSGELHTAKVNIGINGAKTVVIGSEAWENSFRDYLDSLVEDDEDDDETPRRPN